MRLDRLIWPLTFLVSLALAAIATVLIFGSSLDIDPEVRALAMRVAKATVAGLGALLVPLLAAAAQDRDGDGVPDGVNWIRRLLGRDGPRNGGGGAAVVFVVLACAAFSGNLVACGGVPTIARQGVEGLALGVDAADVAGQAHSRAEGERLRREMVEQILAGTLEDAGAASAWFVERYDEATGTILEALEGMRDALEAVEAGLDAWDAGAGEGQFVGAAACVAVALGELVAIFDRSELEVPEALSSAARVISGFARGACPRPPRATEADHG